MRVSDLSENWGLKKFDLNLGICKIHFEPEIEVQEAAWEMYVELFTRITTQSLLPGAGDNQRALKSVHKIFGITRKILKEKGRKGFEFTKLSIYMLNKIIRPFTAKWHPISLNEDINSKKNNSDFRGDLLSLQTNLRKFGGMLLQIANIDESLLKLEKEEIELLLREK